MTIYYIGLVCLGWIWFICSFGFGLGFGFGLVGVGFNRFGLVWLVWFVSRRMKEKY